MSDLIVPLVHVLLNLIVVYLMFGNYKRWMKVNERHENDMLRIALLDLRIDSLERQLDEKTDYLWEQIAINSNQISDINSHLLAMAHAEVENGRQELDLEHEREIQGLFIRPEPMG